MIFESRGASVLFNLDTCFRTVLDLLISNIVFKMSNNDLHPLFKKLNKNYLKDQIFLECCIFIGSEDSSVIQHKLTFIKAAMPSKSLSSAVLTQNVPESVSAII